MLDLGPGEAETRDQVPDTVARIYDAALDPTGWDELPAIFARLTDAGSGVVAVLHAGGPVETVTANQPEEAGRQYSDYYRHVNPLDPLIARFGPMQVRSCVTLMPVLAFRQTEFYVDFAHKFETDYILGTSVIPLAAGVIGHLSVHRSGGRPFSTRHERAMQLYLPHLQRAVQLRLRFGHGSDRLGFAALEALSVGCAICDARGAVIFANAAAEAIEAAGGVRLGGAFGLSATQPTMTRRLAVLIADATHGGSGGSLLVQGPNGGQVAVLVAPLPSRFSDQPGHALVTLRNTRAASHLSPQLLGELFGMTPAEARLAIELAEGQSLAEIGATRAVSENTLRTQLAGALRKTGTNNQRELVRLLGLLPPVTRRD